MPACEPGGDGGRVLTRRSLLFYGLGRMGDGLANGAIQNLQYPIFNMLLGLSPGWIGFVSSTARIWDGCCDLIVGHWSDRSHTRWGRRRPFLVVGGLLTAAVTAGFFQVEEGWDAEIYFAWFLVASLAYNAFSSLFGVPYFALGLELTTDYDERTRVVAYRSFFDRTLGMLEQWLFRFTECFHSPLVGAKVLGVVFAIFGAVATLATVATCRERAPENTDAGGDAEGRLSGRGSMEKSQAQSTGDRRICKKESLFASVRGVLGVGVYRRFLLVHVWLSACNGLFQPLGLYLNVYYVYGGDKIAGATLQGGIGTLGPLLSLIAIPIAGRLSLRMDKVGALRIAVALYAVGCLLKWICITPSNPWLQIFLPFFFSVGIGSSFMLLGSMQADIVDMDELENGARREGVFSAVGGWIMKIGVALGVMGSGWVIVAVGFDVRLGGQQADGVFTAMRFCVSVLPAVGSLCLFPLLRRYPLTRVRCREVREELDRRRTRSLNADCALDSRGN